MNILTPFQERLLRALSESDFFQKHFFLTGGTALSTFYLRHRLSEDLDFFTEAPGIVPLWFPEFEAIAKSLAATLRVSKRFETYFEIFLFSDSETLKIDFAQDAPVRLRPLEHSADYNIRVDNILDIGCNKMSALFDRAEAKDFVDVYFIAKEVMPFDELYAFARQKHIGLDDYWLAVSLKKVDGISALPKMLKPVTKEDLCSFFHAQASNLMRKTP